MSEQPTPSEAGKDRFKEEAIRLAKLEEVLAGLTVENNPGYGWNTPEETMRRVRRLIRLRVESRQPSDERLRLQFERLDVEGILGTGEVEFVHNREYDDWIFSPFIPEDTPNILIVHQHTDPMTYEAVKALIQKDSSDEYGIGSVYLFNPSGAYGKIIYFPTEIEDPRPNIEFMERRYVLAEMTPGDIEFTGMNINQLIDLFRHPERYQEFDIQ